MDGRKKYDDQCRPNKTYMAFDSNATLVPPLEHTHEKNCSPALGWKTILLERARIADTCDLMQLHIVLVFMEVLMDLFIFQYLSPFALVTHIEYMLVLNQPWHNKVSYLLAYTFPLFVILFVPDDHPTSNFGKVWSPVSKFGASWPLLIISIM